MMLVCIDRRVNSNLSNSNFEILQRELKILVARLTDWMN